MTKDNEIEILQFLTRTGMYVGVPDESNMISFITGYEMGSATFKFHEPFQKFISDTYKIKPGATAWPGQIRTLSGKYSLSWVVTFKRTALEFIFITSTAGPKDELNKVLKSRINSLIERIDEKGNPWFNINWVEEWKAYNLINSFWFKQIWSNHEFKVIKAIDKAVQNNNVFSDKENKLPVTELIHLKEQYKSQ